MNQVAQAGYRWLRAFGIDPVRTVSAFRYLPRYLGERRKFGQATGQGGLPLGSAYPILDEYAETAGAAKGHYFHMDLWAARRIYRAQPERHVDIGSRVDGFIAHLLVFRDVDVIDIRPLESNIDGMHFVQADATRLDGMADDSVASLSCLHAAEHFGLGRYGDPVDPNGYRDLIKALSRVVSRNGRIYFAVPIGRERVEFNAHRVFDPRRIVEDFAPLTLLSFAAVDDAGDLVKDAQLGDFDDAKMSCGLFEFTKN